MATSVHIISHAAALAAGLASGLVAAGSLAQSGVPGSRPTTTEFRAGAGAAATIETFVGNRTCADITAQIDGCTPSVDLKEVTMRWPRIGTTRIHGVATYCPQGTWARGGAGVTTEKCVTAEFIVGAAAAAAAEDWISNRACDDVTAQLGDCDIGADIKSVTFRWERLNTVQPLHVVVALDPQGTWTRGDPQ